MHERTSDFREDGRTQETELIIAEKAMLLLDDFGMGYTTEAVRQAGALYEQYGTRALSDDELFSYAAQTEPATFYQAYGIATDFPVAEEFWRSHAPDPSNRRWNIHSPMINPQELFEHAGSINLESMLIQATHTLAELETRPYDSVECYDAVVRAEAMHAPLCEIIGFDALAMALRSKATVIRLRNNGQSHFVNEAERLLLAYEGTTRDGEPLFAHFETSLLNKLIGETSHESVINNNAEHGVVVGEGTCAIPGENNRLRVLARLKTVGSLAEKLAREAAKSDYDAPHELDDAAVDQSLTPLDITGITLVAKNDTALANTYVALVRGMHANQDSITPVAAPSRTQAFHIRGSKSFVDTLREELERHFPDHQRLFEYVIDDHGFHVAKVTGFYEDNEGCVPFEIQALTAEGRKQSRIGKGAHIFYKLSRQMNTPFTPTEQEISGLEQINSRKIHLGKDGLTPASAARIDQRINELIARQAEPLAK